MNKNIEKMFKQYNIMTFEEAQEKRRREKEKKRKAKEAQRAKSQRFASAPTERSVDHNK